MAKLVNASHSKCDNLESFKGSSPFLHKENFNSQFNYNIFPWYTNYKHLLKITL